MPDILRARAVELEEEAARLHAASRRERGYRDAGRREYDAAVAKNATAKELRRLAEMHGAVVPASELSAVERMRLGF